MQATKFREVVKIVSASVALTLSGIPLFFHVDLPKDVKSPIQFALQVVGLAVALFIHPPRRKSVRNHSGPGAD